jgi:hypothetical protein
MFVLQDNNRTETGRKQMSYLAEAHAEWHLVYGQVACPLDCGIGYDWEAEERYEREAEAAWREANPEAAAQRDAEDAARVAETDAWLASRGAKRDADFDEPPF